MCFLTVCLSVSMYILVDVYSMVWADNYCIRRNPNPNLPNPNLRNPNPNLPNPNLRNPNPNLRHQNPNGPKINSN